MAKLLVTLLFLVCLLLLTSLLLLASHNIPAASAVATETDVANVLAAVGFPWVPAVVIVSAVAGVPAPLVILTAVDVPGARAVANDYRTKESIYFTIDYLNQEKLSMPTSAFYQSVIFWIRIYLFL